jgi:SAM-dependent methyltransferase
MRAKDHWERVYTTKPVNVVSWYQEHAEHSLRLIQGTAAGTDAHVIDIGGGASTLVDDLLAAGYSRLTVLDLSAAAIAAAQKRLGRLATRVEWLQADITTAVLPASAYDVWHDRAVFHFLTEADQRAAYVRAVLRAVKPGGYVIVATFAEDGPTQCSGLPVRRYSPGELHAEFGQPFELLKHERETHHTPFGTVQKFVFCYCRKSAS